MSKDIFKFKQFIIRQDKCAMKVGTDGVLLGAWVNLNFAPQTAFYRFLDVGTGAGIIALMLAQRKEDAFIDAIEKDVDAYSQCFRNIQDSLFERRIYPKPLALQEFEADTLYDLTVSNPPYFSGSLKSPDDKRNTARHNDDLPLKILIEKSLKMLTDKGRIALILPVKSAEELDVLIATNKLYIVRRTDVITVEGLEPKRFMIELARHQVQNPVFNTITLETKEHKKTKEYQELTKNFYLE
ncbi:MAG: methyltransferase [Tannerella sp.]|jgi:tRNA1Val (adenine37-N6)-methyltransferase|nr:methyltransferase [Tannerella sp.]